MNEQKKFNVIVLHNGVVVRPRNIQRILPYGPDYRNTIHPDRVSEKFWFKVVEGKNEYSIQCQDQTQRDGEIHSIIKAIDAQ